MATQAASHKPLKDPFRFLSKKTFPSRSRIMLVGREAEGFDDAPFNRMEGWGPDCHKWTGASMARPAEKCGPGISKTVLRSSRGKRLLS